MSLKYCFILFCLAITVFWICPPQTIMGRQAETASTNMDSDSDVNALVKKWEELDREIADKEVEFNAASGTDLQADLRGQYTALVEQSTALINQIKSKAIESLTAGDLDEATSKLLVGLVMNDAEFDRNNEAIKLGDQMIGAGVDGKLFERAAKANRLSVYSKELMEELYVRSNQAKQDDLPQIKIETSKGNVVVELFEDEAPNSVANFVSLVEDKFYDGLKFHRVIEGFVAQGGDPNGDGSGGPGYSIKCECETPEARRHFYGSLSMAHAGKDSGGSQFFLCLNRTSHLDGRHTVFGRVTEGIEVLDKLTRNHTTSAAISGTEPDEIKSMTVIRKRDHEYVPEKIGDKSTDDDTKQPPAQPKTNRDDSESEGPDTNSDSEQSDPDDSDQSDPDESDQSDDG